MEPGAPKPEDPSAAAEAKLLAHVSELERKAAEEKAKQTGAQKATTREGVYMLIFQTAVIVLFGGMQGYTDEMARHQRLAHGKGGDFFSERLDDLRAVGEGFLVQFQTHWHMDLGLFFLVAVIAFGIKRAKPRRRYFSWAVMVTLATFTVILMGNMKGLMGN